MRAAAPTFKALSPDFAEAYDPARGLSYSPSLDALVETGEGRLADMDKNSIDMQVLSTLYTQHLPAEVAVDLVHAANTKLERVVRSHPDRFAGFAALPTAVPEAAAIELDRCITDLGFVGTLIMGRTDGEFLDNPRFDPVLRAAARLDVPIYLHPSPPPAVISETNYAAGLDPVVTARFQTSAWGWHQETGVHFLHMVLAGVFDRYPNLQIILGHWGEMVPFYVDRLDEALPRAVTGLDRNIGDYLRENVYLTPSGMFSHAQLQFCIDTVGVDRIMYSVDYPFIGNEGAAAFLQEARLSGRDRDKIASTTAKKLLGISL